MRTLGTALGRPGAARRGTIVVVLKNPAAGRAKTRLARAVGAGRAAMLARAMARATIAEAEKCEAALVLAIDPPGDVFSARWPRRARRIAQASGDLGARLRAVLRAAPRGPIVLIGADAPGLRAAHLRAAFAGLGRCDAVFGPAVDGGYWLVGLARRRRSPSVFTDVRWSSPHALCDTIASLPADFAIALMPVLEDIDDAQSLAAAGPLIRSRRCAREGPRPARLTRRPAPAQSSRRRMRGA